MLHAFIALSQSLCNFLVQVNVPAALAEIKEDGILLPHIDQLHEPSDCLVEVSFENSYSRTSEF